MAEPGGWDAAAPPAGGAEAAPGRPAVRRPGAVAAVTHPPPPPQHHPTPEPAYQGATDLGPPRAVRLSCRKGWIRGRARHAASARTAAHACRRTLFSLASWRCWHCSATGLTEVLRWQTGRGAARACCRMRDVVGHRGTHRSLVPSGGRTERGDKGAPIGARRVGGCGAKGGCGGEVIVASAGARTGPGVRAPPPPRAAAGPAVRSGALFEVSEEL